MTLDEVPSSECLPGRGIFTALYCKATLLHPVALSPELDPQEDA
jgi:hypothetical protein